MAGSVRKLQKKIEKARKKRQVLKKESRKLEAKYEGASLLRMAANAPFGPCWVSVSLDGPEDEVPPALITVLVTRRVRGQLLGLLVLVDRTCLGVKNANLLPLQTELSLNAFLDDVLQALGELRECEPVEAQAVVFHALEYAASLGFGYHPDFEPILLEPRPQSLPETPLAHPARPYYSSGPDDDVDMIVAQLDRVVGPGNYDLLDDLSAVSFFSDELMGEDEDEDETIETSAEVVD